MILGPTPCPRSLNRSSLVLLFRTSKISACHAWGPRILSLFRFLSLSFSPPSSISFSTFSPASYIELPPWTSPFRANSKAIRMAPASHTRKRKTFSLHVAARPVHFSAQALIDRASLCVDTLSRILPTFTWSFCILSTVYSAIVCPRIVIYVDVTAHTNYNYATEYIKN